MFSRTGFHGRFLREKDVSLFKIETLDFKKKKKIL